MKRRITIRWEIHDTRNMSGGYFTGMSVLVTNSKHAINEAIDFARNLPTSEIKRNGIDLEQYREGNICTYYYMTMISEIVSVEIIKRE